MYTDEFDSKAAVCPLCLPVIQTHTHTHRGEANYSISTHKQGAPKSNRDKEELSHSRKKPRQLGWSLKPAGADPIARVRARRGGLCVCVWASVPEDGHR